MNKIRTRFAPSPTGFLHIGSLRTVLFSYLIAKTANGEFVLRIEDTDNKRYVPGAVEKLLEILAWLGLEFDEGPHLGGNFGPYTQSERQKIYQKYSQLLLESGHAYRCFCSPERLAKMRRDQQKKKLPPRYDRRCRNLSPQEISNKLKKGERFVIRQKMPLKGNVVVYDELRGKITFRAADLEDHILIKSDGVPTYQFAVVIDDHLMQITHVTRSDEWIPSFPKNVLLYKAFGWQPPKFIHFPVVLNKQGRKLSKRHGDVTVEDYRQKGYLPEALINFNALLGWHPKGNNEILSLNDLLKSFNYLDIGTSPAIFETEKLDYFNGYYIRQKSLPELVELCRPWLLKNFALTKNKYKKSPAFLKKVVAIEQERLKKLSDITEATIYLFQDEIDFDVDLLIWKKMTKKSVADNLKTIISLLEKIPSKNWTDDSLKDSIFTYLNAKKLKVGEYLWPFRVALTGKKASPDPFAIAELLNKDESLKRIKQALTKLKSQN